MTTYQSIAKENKDTLSMFSKTGKVLVVSFAKREFSKWNNKPITVYVPKY